MKLLRLCAVLPALSACGGGGGAVAPLPAPPIVSPSPPPVTYDSFTSASTNKTVDLTGVLLARTDVNGATGVPQTSVKTFENSTLRLAFNAATGTYTLFDGARSQSFAPVDLRNDMPLLGPAFDTYRAGTDTDTHFLSLLRPAGDAQHVQLTYTTVANWVQRVLTADGSSTSSQSRSLWAVGGFATVAGDMPKSGQATYTGFVQGQGSGANVLSGQSRLIANFATGALTADLFLNGITPSTITVSGPGTIAAGSSRFTGTLAGGGYSGTFDGGFFGPSAAEMGFGFALASDAQGRIDGVAAGRK
jgi:hypothetical protein